MSYYTGWLLPCLGLGTVLACLTLPVDSCYSPARPRVSVPESVATPLSLGLYVVVCILYSGLSLPEYLVSGSALVVMQCSYLLLTCLRVLLNDHSCSHSSHANSISGHYHDYTLLLLSLGYLAVRKHSPVTPRLVLCGISMTCLSLLCVLELWDTYFGGYHSPRQVLYGIVLGGTAHLVHVTLVRRYLDDSRPPPLYSSVELQ